MALESPDQTDLTLPDQVLNGDLTALQPAPNRPEPEADTPPNSGQNSSNSSVRTRLIQHAEELYKKLGKGRVNLDILAAKMALLELLASQLPSRSKADVPAKKVIKKLKQVQKQFTE